jgi:hypothetical protein
MKGTRPHPSAIAVIHKGLAAKALLLGGAEGDPGAAHGNHWIGENSSALYPRRTYRVMEAYPNN